VPEWAEALIAASRKARGEKTWIITDGSVGMEEQGIAVAEAVGLPFSLKRAHVKGAMRFLPTRLQIYVPPTHLLSRILAAGGALAAPRHFHRQTQRSHRACGQACERCLRPPHPKSESAASALRLVAAPAHDNFDGPNVVTTFGAVHSVTSARLAEAAKRFAPRVDCLPHPRIAVLSEARAQPSAFRVTLARPSGPSLPHSPAKTAARCWSRPSAAREPTRSPRCLPPSRTCPTSSGTARATTPYFAFLALADAIVAMEDSVNMVTEAAGTA
jgi:uncharacterized protein